ncbi:hypothetical protein [Nonomuraea sp. bgisy101]|uniref:hypothetical protein n=1 Tax=Nonomuraea sp. bgisy101 TaxID=3413784 RepID=UPI003D744054
MNQRISLVESIKLATTGPNEACHFIEAFSREWLDVRTNIDVYSNTEITQTENRLGFPLPAPISTIYNILGQGSDITTSHGNILPLDELRQDLSAGVLIWRIEDEGEMEFAVGYEADDPADPAELFRADSADGPTPWEVWRDTISSSCVEILLEKALYNGPDDLRLAFSAESDIVATYIKNAYSHVKLPSRSWGSRSEWLIGENSFMKVTTSQNTPTGDPWRDAQAGRSYVAFRGKNQTVTNAVRQQLTQLMNM